MSVDRLLWCHEYATNDTIEAQTQYMAISKEMRKANIPEEMTEVFFLRDIDTELYLASDTLQMVLDSWLR